MPFSSLLRTGPNLAAVSALPLFPGPCFSLSLSFSLFNNTFFLPILISVFIFQSCGWFSPGSSPAWLSPLLLLSPGFTLATSCTPWRFSSIHKEKKEIGKTRSDAEIGWKRHTLDAERRTFFLFWKKLFEREVAEVLVRTMASQE